MSEWVVVAGGCGFLGSHLSEELLAQGYAVLVLDDASTGDWDNVAHLTQYGASFAARTHDVRRPVLDVVADAVGSNPIVAVCNLASPASPPAYLARPIDTLEVGSIGTQNLIALAMRYEARLLQASTSEIYGDPEITPQPESYWGNVNPVGPRSVYDEAKRFGEAICAAFERQHGLDLRLVRIFNTYGPRMQPDDGRVVTNFIHRALEGTPLIVGGDGSQTRSFCHVDDLVDGLLRLLWSDHRGPMNIGNPGEFTILELAKMVCELTGSSSVIEFGELPVDDPKQRCPDITLAKRVLGWEPTIALRDGLARTIDWFQAHPER